MKAPEVIPRFTFLSFIQIFKSMSNTCQASITVHLFTNICSHTHTHGYSEFFYNFSWHIPLQTFSVVYLYGKCVSECQHLGTNPCPSGMGQPWVYKQGKIRFN